MVAGEASELKVVRPRFDPRGFMIVVQTLLDQAFQDARLRNLLADSIRQLHRDKSQSLVDTIACRFQSHYGDEPDVRVFWGNNPDNQPDFRLSELLFDITVCRMRSVEHSLVRKSHLPQRRCGLPNLWLSIIQAWGRR